VFLVFFSFLIRHYKNSTSSHTQKSLFRRGLLYGTDLISFKSIIDSCFSVYFGTATYVDYLMFSHLNLITNPTPRPNATLTIGATARNPNYRGSRVYPNYRGSCTQPKLSGLPHATLTIGAAACNLKGRGSRARPGQGRRCAQASPSRLALRARGSGFALALRFALRAHNN
jgi:hypothetical protein